MRVAYIPLVKESLQWSIGKISQERGKQVTARYWPVNIGASESMVDQIMKTIHLERAEAVSMAIGMIITQIVMAAEMAGSAQGIA
jgi:hypothetical protein